MAIEEVGKRLYLEGTIRHMRHPIKEGLLTLAGDEDCDIPKLTHEFCLGVADLEHDDLPDSD